MSVDTAAELTFEAVCADQVRDFQLSLIPIIFSDIERQGLDVPDYNNRLLCVMAATPDGQVAGGVKAGTSHNELELYALAVNPECPVEGAYTFLLQHVEAAARSTLACNRLLVNLYDWQPRALYEQEGYTVVGVVENHPHGHTQVCMEKVWPAASSTASCASVCEYESAATGLMIQEWDSQVATAQLNSWLDAQRRWCTSTSAFPVPTRDAGMIAFRGLHADGSLAAGIVCGTLWNVVHVKILVVVPSEQRRGVGTAMLQRLLEVAREKNCDTVVLETSSWQARPFYEKNGFSVFAKHDDLPPGFSRYRLSRAIPGR